MIATSLCLLAILLLLLWLRSSPMYWRTRKIPHLTPWPLIGNFHRIALLGIDDFLGELYEKFHGERYFGLHMFTRPVLFVKDPELMQKILVTDFEHFTAHGYYSNKRRDPVGQSMLYVHGEQWRALRGKTMPMFTPSRIKAMTASIDMSMCKVIEILDEYAKDQRPADIDDVMTKVAIDLGACTIFGIQSDIFENENSLFKDLAKSLLTPSFTMRLFIGQLWPKLYNLLRFTVYGDMFNICMKSIVFKAIECSRNRHMEKQVFIKGMIDLMNTETSEKQQKLFPDGTRVPRFDMNLTVAQGLLMFSAATETTALTMIFCMYEMAIRPDVQAKCRAEIYEVLKRDKCDRITADNAASLVYLTAVLQETLRLHPILNLSTRECTKDYRVPDSDFTIETGTLILMSKLSLHTNPNYHTDPHVFRPERFLAEEKNSMKSATYLPFGLGPRICLGMNLAKIEMNIIVSRLLQRYEFSSRERLNVPMKHATFSIVTKPATRLWLDVRRLK